MANDLGYTPISNINYKDPITVSLGQNILDNVVALITLLNNYKEGVSISLIDTDNFEVQTGAIMINGKLRRNTTTSTVSWNNTGGNGIIETSSTGYYIWAVASGVTSTFEIALNLTSSNMTGNANARLIGWLWNDTGKNIEGIWYKDQDNRKHYHSTWLNVARNTGYVIFHNLGTRESKDTLLFSQSSDGTSGHLATYDEDTSGTFDAGVMFKHESTTQGILSIGTDCLIGQSAVLTGNFTQITSGYVKILAETY